MYFGFEGHPTDAIERQALLEERPIGIPYQGGFLLGSLATPPAARALVLIANDSGSARHIAPLRALARRFRAKGLATLMVDLLELAEQNASLATQALRIGAAREWLAKKSELNALPLVLLGMGLAAPAALMAAAADPSRLAAVIACGPFPGLAGAALENVKAPALLIAHADRFRDLKSQKAALASLQGEHELVVLHEPADPFDNALDIADAAVTFLSRESCHLRTVS
jgi:putative phosphoribosyl transferase